MRIEKSEFTSDFGSDVVIVENMAEHVAILEILGGYAIGCADLDMSQDYIDNVYKTQRLVSELISSASRRALESGDVDADSIPLSYVGLDALLIRTAVETFQRNPFYAEFGMDPFDAERARAIFPEL